MLLRMIIGQLIRQKASDQLHSFVHDKLREVQQQQSAEFQQSLRDRPLDVVTVFPTALESGGLIERLENVVSFKTAGYTEHFGERKNKRFLVAETGTDPTSSVENLEVVLRLYQPRFVVIGGFASALSPNQKRFESSERYSLVRYR